MVKLFIVGFPQDIQEAELIEMFSNHGMLHSISLVNDKVTLKPKGYGFIDMIDRAGAERAIDALNGLVIRGRTVTVKLADKSTDKAKKNIDTQFDDRQKPAAKKDKSAKFKEMHQKKFNS